MSAARDSTTSTAATDAHRAEARSLAAEVQTWGTSRSELPATDKAAAAMNRLNSYGEDLRDAVSAAYGGLSTASGLHHSTQAILGEAGRRLGKPPLGGTSEDVVRRAQNLARLVQGLLRILDAVSDPATRRRELSDQTPRCSPAN